MSTAYVDKTRDRDFPQTMVSEPAALNYASPGIRVREPFDFVGFVRQTFFATGVGLLVFGIVVSWGNDRSWSADGAAWAGVGAGLISLVLPWPGRLGRRRDEGR